MLTYCIKPSDKLDAVSGLEIFLLFETFIFIVYVTVSNWSKNQLTNSYDAYGPIIIFCFLLLLLGGFGLLLAHFRTNSNRGVLYNTVILCVTVQLYFLVSIFFTKANLSGNAQSFTDDIIPAWMGLTPLLSDYGASLTNSIGCALAIFVSYTALHGIMSQKMLVYHNIVTVILWEFTRQCFERLRIKDAGGSMGIFLFGSSNGILLRLFLNTKETSEENKTYSTRKERINYTFAMLGGAFIWCLLPLFNCVNLSIRQNLLMSNPFVMASVVNVWVALAAGVVWTFLISKLVHKNKIFPEDIIFGCFAGGIAFGSSSGIVHLPVGPLVVGIVCATANVLMARSCQQYPRLKSWSLPLSFLLASLQGGLWSMVFVLATPLIWFRTVMYRPQTYNDAAYTVQAAIQLSGVGIAIVAAFVSASISWVAIKILGALKCHQAARPEIDY